MRALIMIAALLTPLPAAAQIFDRVRCSIQSQDLNFGPYSTLDPAPNTANTHIEVTCDPPGEVFFVQLFVSDGRAEPLDRIMSRGRNDLHYNIYTDPTYRRVAGDGSNGTVAPIRIVSGPGRATFRLYGKIPARQLVEAGQYDDRLRLTVEF
jgi:spore coat protein U-like protein